MSLLRIDLKEIKKEAFSFFSRAKGSHGWDHVKRVVALCEHIGTMEGSDMNVVIAAAYLHDIARNESDSGNGEECHAKKGAEMIPKILGKLHLDEGFIKRVAHCVAAHRFRNDLTPDTIEAKVLFDADKLDSLGAIGIGRAFLFAGEVGAKLHDPNVDLEKTKAYSVDDTAYREWLVKLCHIKDRMLTATGRSMAEERHIFMENFFEKLNDEAGGKS